MMLDITIGRLIHNRSMANTIFVTIVLVKSPKHYIVKKKN